MAARGLQRHHGLPCDGCLLPGPGLAWGRDKNRFDACVSNDFSVNGHINFAPTGKDGTVADNNGIAGTLNSQEIENFLWMLPDEQGVLAGTQGGEWVIASSAAGEPITPTSILTREMTHYGSLNTGAIKVGRATIFAHRDTRKVYEYMANYFTQKYVADNLSLKAKHLTGGLAELAYMRELTRSSGLVLMTGPHRLHLQARRPDQALGVRRLASTYARDGAGCHQHPGRAGQRRGDRYPLAGHSGPFYAVLLRRVPSDAMG
jgi:hypothetical protein